MARTARPVTGITDFVYDGSALIAAYTNAGALLRRAACPERSRRVHADPRGSIVAVSDYQGISIATNAYDEYGIPDAATQAAGSAGDISTKGRFRYTGQAYIPELGMYYYKACPERLPQAGSRRARIYSPTLGRFLQTDPIGYEDQFNLYAYVANDPVNGVDPTGMYKCKKSDCAAVAAFVGRLREAQGSAKEGTEDKARIDRTVARLGDEGKKGSDGYIQIKVDTTIGTPAHYTEKGRIITVNPEMIKTVDQGANNIGHEVGHDEYFRENGTIASLADREATEINGFENGSAIDRALGVPEIFPDIKDGVRRSVETACSENPEHRSCN